MRGARGLHDGYRHPAGLIPARAGSTRRRTISSTGTRAHPRPCGEHGVSLVLWVGWWGSSPPVRGARVVENERKAAEGLIPARAGSTPGLSALSVPRRAHPRPCGEHLSTVRDISSVLGSSPPVRGAPGIQAYLHAAPGLIPARAGSTLNRHPALGLVRAHPRPCGEHSCQ